MCFHIPSIQYIYSEKTLTFVVRLKVEVKVDGRREDFICCVNAARHMR